MRLIAAGNPVIQDAVITGHDRDEVGALVFPSAGCATLEPAAVARVHRGGAAGLAGAGGSSTRVARALLLAEPPSIDAGEITDKGYINQMAVLARRAAAVEALYAGGADVILP